MQTIPRLKKNIPLSEIALDPPRSFSFPNRTRTRTRPRTRFSFPITVPPYFRIKKTKVPVKVSPEKGIFPNGIALSAPYPDGGTTRNLGGGATS
jgi:hypothetical protein